MTTALEELLSRLPNRGYVKITVAFPGEYWVSYNDGKRTFIPGTPSYDSLEVASLRALRYMDAVGRDEQEEAQP